MPSSILNLPVTVQRSILDYAIGSRHVHMREPPPFQNILSQTKSLRLTCKAWDLLIRTMIQRFRLSLSHNPSRFLRLNPINDVLCINSNIQHRLFLPALVCGHQEGYTPLQYPIRYIHAIIAMTPELIQRDLLPAARNPFPLFLKSPLTPHLPNLAEFAVLFAYPYADSSVKHTAYCYFSDTNTLMARPLCQQTALYSEDIRRCLRFGPPVFPSHALLLHLWIDPPCLDLLGDPREPWVEITQPTSDCSRSMRTLIIMWVWLLQSRPHLHPRWLLHLDGYRFE